MDGDLHDMNEITVDDFSGGMTDNYINCPLNRGQLYDNLFILPNRRLRSRWGYDLDVRTLANAQIPAGNQRIGALINYNNSSTLFVQSAKKIYYRNPTAYTTLVGPTSNDVFNEGGTSNYISHAEWNRHLYVTNDAFPNLQKIYSDGSSVIQVRSAGLPALASSPSVAAGGVGARSYIYAFIHYYTYTIGTEVFEDFGPVTQVSLDNSLEPSASNNAITGIPVLANSTTNNYDTSNVKIYIYRTLDGETSFYKIGQVTNGTTVFTDNVSDATAETGDELYINGGFLDNDPPPKCKYIHITNNIGYFAHIKDGAEIRPNTYRISLQFDIDSCPADFEDTVEDEITGISSVNSLPIIGCKRHVYRSDGFFDEFGRGFLTHTRISDTAGCISNSSMVQAEGQLFWAGNDGFYVTDGYKVLKISDHLNDTYSTYIANMANTKAIIGAYDEKYRRVIWSLQVDDSSSDNDAFAILELRWGVSSESVFTTMSGSSFSPTGLTIFNRQVYHADRRGYVCIHDEDNDSDRKIDVSISDPANWPLETIIYNYLGPATNFGSARRKWIPQATITLGNMGNVSVQPNAINDDGFSTRALKQIRFRGNFVWGDDEFLWGSAGCQWGSSGVIEQKRRMPARGLRLSYLQLQLTNAYTVITNSDDAGTATMAAANTATLDTAGVNWPNDSIDYYLSFPGDSYTLQYLVTARTATVLTFVDAAGSSPIGSGAWLLKGYRKGEILHLLSYSIPFSPTSQTNDTWHSADAGENA